MKTKTSITLSPEILGAIDELAGPGRSRSAVIERILRQFVKRYRRTAMENGDLAALNRNADRLNLEAADVSEYQAWPGE